jgi:hypothetical protein
LAITHPQTTGLALLIILLAGTVLLAVPHVGAADLLSLDFESEQQGWTATATSQQQTLRFERESSIVYQGTYALNFTSYASTSQPQTVAWLHNTTAQQGSFPLNVGTKLQFAWDVPTGGTLFVGLTVEFTDGRNITYASGDIGDFSNSSAYSLLLLDTSAQSWVSHERDVYGDYAAAWGQPGSSVGIQALGVVHAYLSGIGLASQASYYDAILLFSPTAEFVLSATPSSSAVVIGGAERYRIDVESNYGFSGTVSLSVSQVPANVTSDLSQTQVTVSPSQNASVTLTLTTNPTTPLGSFAVEVTGTSGELNRSLTVTLAVARPSLIVNLSTDKLQYTQNGTVIASGQVNAFTGEPVPNASIHVEAVDPQGNSIQSSNLTSDTGGAFEGNFTIPLSAENGTYTIYALVSKAGFEDSFESTNFVVGQTNTPAIVLTVLRVTDLENNTKVQFRLGETAMVWVRLVNAGAAMNQSMLWFTVDNPQGVSVLVTVEVGSLGAGESSVRGFSFQIGTTSALGVYHVGVLATDNFIHLGGTILDSVDSTLIVTP